MRYAGDSRGFCIACAFVMAVGAGMARADDVVLDCSRDNTLIEGGDLSNGAGDAIFSGNTSHSGRRRGLIRFDLGAIPAGSTVTSASVELGLIATQAADGPSSLHRVLADWGEGTSASFGGSGAPATAGDATWTQRFFNTAAWTTPGGDFAAAPSSTTTIAVAMITQTYPTSGALVADVQGWVDTPAQNFGWAVIGDEEPLQTSRKFGSRENADPAFRPRLRVSYTPPLPVCPADFNHSGAVSVQDIFDFLSAYFAGDPAADFNHSGAVSVQDIFDFLGSYFAGCP